MSELLERRYARLLRCYPATDRERLSGELLATLSDLARPGQRWPDPRQATALILAGIRARSGGIRYRPREIWGHGLQITVLAVLITRAFADLMLATRVGVSGDLMSGLVALSAVPLVLRGKFALALIASVLAAGVQFLFGTFSAVTVLSGYLPASLWQGSGASYAFTVAALTVLATWLRPEHARRSPWWLMPLTVVAIAHNLAFDELHPGLPWPTGPDGDLVREAMSWTFLLGLPALCAAWALIDARVSAAGAWWLAAALVPATLHNPVWWPYDTVSRYELVSMVQPTVEAAVALCVVAFCCRHAARRQAP